MAPRGVVKIEPELYAVLVAEANVKFRTVKAHLEYILRKHFKKQLSKKGKS